MDAAEWTSSVLQTLLLQQLMIYEFLEPYIYFE